jgi:transcriptional regulator with XRE-family HTH domain
VTERTPTGPVGRQVVANIERLRKEQRLSFAALSGRLAEIGRPTAKSQIHALSKAERRVDVDDLTAFAEVFGVSVAALLARPGTAAAQDHPAVRAARALTDRVADLVTAADNPQAAQRADRALRRVALEIEELLEHAIPGGRTG